MAMALARRVLRSTLAMKRRRILIAVSVLCVLTQLGLGASSALGLVLCVGTDHAAIELPSDDCCDTHGGMAGRSAATFETSCCSDVPLVSAFRSVSDLRRAEPMTSPGVAVATAVVSSPDRVAWSRVEPVATWWPPPRVLRPSILRV
jgi:hypothetical protein